MIAHLEKTTARTPVKTLEEHAKAFEALHLSSSERVIPMCVQQLVKKLNGRNKRFFNAGKLDVFKRQGRMYIKFYIVNGSAIQGNVPEYRQGNVGYVTSTGNKMYANITEHVQSVHEPVPRGFSLFRFKG